jgi:dTDP-4-amino-4,6-dideoxygalactose transaminase
MYEMGKKELEAVRRVIESGQTFRYRGGEGGFTDRFEAALARKMGVKHVITTTSGTGALICAMVGLGVGPGDEVIVPAYTFMATALAPLAVGAVPVIVDVDESLTMDPAAVEKAITRYTKAIIPVDMCGLPCDMAAIMRIARKRGLFVCEDACQAVGGSYRGRRLTSIGHVGVFSFNHFKNIACGEGGAVLTNDVVIYDRALIYHDGGAVFRKYADRVKTPFFPGLNFRVSEFQGAIMGEQLRRLDGILARLRARKRILSEILAGSDAFQLSPNNDIEGDCGSTLPLLFPTERAAKAYVEDKKCGGRPYDSGRHVYINWEPILRKNFHHPALNPWKMARRPISYSRGMCARTLDILARTVCIGVPYGLTLAETRALARKLKA